MFYIEIKDNKIIGKGHVSVEVALAENQKEVSEEIYNELIRLPADFTEDELGNIVSITNAPEPPEFATVQDVDSKVIEMIRREYDQNEEYKMLRLGILDASNSDFAAYNSYIEQCRIWGHDKKVELGFVSEVV